MAYGDTDISLNTVYTDLGETGNKSIQKVVQSANVNKYSFDRPRTISTDGSNNIQIDSKTTNLKLGDFRRYNHSAATPAAAGDYTQNYNPGVGSFNVTLNTTIGELNVKELNGSTTHFIVDGYLSTSDRASQINKHVSLSTTAISFSTVTPATGHSNQQTQKPSSTTQNLTVSVNTSGLVQPDDILYFDTYLGTSGGVEHIRFDDAYTTVNVHEYANPFIDGTGPNFTPAASGFTFMAVKVTNSSSGKNGVDFTETNGSTSYGGAGFYWYIYGLNGSNYYRIGNRTVTAVLRIPGGTDTTILSGALNAPGASSNENDSGTLAASQTWAWDDEADVVITSVDWDGSTDLIASGDTYDLGTTPPS